MASYSCAGTGVDSRKVSASTKPRATPTAELAYVRVERDTPTGVRSIMIQHQVQIMPDGTKRWCEIPMVSEQEIDADNKRWKAEHEAKQSKAE